MHRDTVIGIVGVVILVAAMVGVFTYERGQASLLGDGTGAATANLTGPTAEGTVPVGSTADADVVINQTGLTNITFTITWSAGANAADTLRVVAQPANDTGLTTAFESDAEDDGEIVITVPLNNADAAGVIGTGNWRLTVEFVSSQVSAGPGVDPPDPLPGGDASVDFSVATALQAYSTGEA